MCLVKLNLSTYLIPSLKILLWRWTVLEHSVKIMYNLMVSAVNYYDCWYTGLVIQRGSSYHRILQLLIYMRECIIIFMIKRYIHTWTTVREEAFKSTKSKHPSFSAACKASRRPQFFIWNILVVMVTSKDYFNYLHVIYNIEQDDQSVRVSLSPN